MVEREKKEGFYSDVYVSQLIPYMDFNDPIDSVTLNQFIMNNSNLPVLIETLSLKKPMIFVVIIIYYLYNLFLAGQNLSLSLFLTG